MQEILEQCAKNIETNGLKKNKVAHSVLIADDAMFVRRTIARILTAVGYEIVGEAENGQEACDKYFELQPSIVTMDITMPIMEGIEAVETIMARDNTAKIVMVSAMGYQNMVKDAILKGAKNFVVKPIKPDNVEKFLCIIKSVAGTGE